MRKRIEQAKKHMKKGVRPHHMKQKLMDAHGLCETHANDVMAFAQHEAQISDDEHILTPIIWAWFLGIIIAFIILTMVL